MSIIHLVCNDGSPLGCSVRTIHGDSHQIGCGGSEYSLLTMCEGLHNRNHQIVLYNDPWEANASPFEQRRINEFDINEKRDFLIIFRSPNVRTIPVKNCKKIWWSCDQYTVGSFSHFYKTVDQTVVISPFHAEHFKNQYGITNVTVTDLPVRTWEYEQDVERIKHKFLFSSVPDRGLEVLWRIWPRIRKELPDASLSITSDYRLWGVSTARNEKHKIRWTARDGHKFVGAVSRKQLIQEQLSSDIHLYLSEYEELFCLSIAESQVAGVYTITNDIGALRTTNMNTVFSGLNAKDVRADNQIIDKLLIIVNDRSEMEKRRIEVQNNAKERFSLQRILSFWDDNILI